MLHHRTTNLGERAHHIAEKEAFTACRRIGSYGAWDQIYFRTYEETLMEFQPPLANPDENTQGELHANH